MKCFISTCINISFWSPSSRGRGLKCHSVLFLYNLGKSPSSRGRGLKYFYSDTRLVSQLSPSSRGRGLKYVYLAILHKWNGVALFTRAWIEITTVTGLTLVIPVALFTRAWIEIQEEVAAAIGVTRRPLHEGVD